MTEDFVDVVPGVRFPRRVVSVPIAYPTRAGKSLECTATLEYDDSEHRFVCRQLIVDAADVATIDLRQITMGWVLKFTLLVGTEPKIQLLDNTYGLDPWGLDVPRGLSLQGPTDRVLRWTAHVYKYGLAVGFGPTETVQEMLDVPRSTAGRWIALARKARYLPASQKGKATG